MHCIEYYNVNKWQDDINSLNIVKNIAGITLQKAEVIAAQGYSPFISK